MKERIERFRELVSEIDISKYKQKTFIKIVINERITKLETIKELDEIKRKEKESKNDK